MKSLIAALLSGLLVSLSLFWLMQTMLMSSQQDIKRTENLAMTDFVRLIRKPPEQKLPEKKPLKVEKVEEVKKVEPKPKPKPKIVEKKPTPPKPEPKVLKKVVAKRPAPVETPKAPPPKLDLPSDRLKTHEPAVNQVNAELHGKGSLTDSSPKSEIAKATPPPKADNGHSNSKASAGGGVSTGVVALVRVPAVYPERAKRRRIQGKVTIEFTITPTGNVINPVVVNSVPDGFFDENALDAIKQWKFKQKIVNGVAVEQRAVQTMHFKLQN